jgi:hypothetical protein
MAGLSVAVDMMMNENVIDQRFVTEACCCLISFDCPLQCGEVPDLFV